MFEYDLTGKQVILVLTEEIVESLKVFGIPGSPLFSTVHQMEDTGLWLDNPRFSVCPINAPKIYDPKGVAMCHAHIFIPANAIKSVVAFPQFIKEMEENPGLHRIGFKTPAR